MDQMEFEETISSWGRQPSVFRCVDRSVFPHNFYANPTLQCATALGATWDKDLIHEAGLKLMAAEAKLRAASIVLAPTCNIQRVRYPRYSHSVIDQPHPIRRTRLVEG